MNEPYPEYKDSGVEWLGLVPEHWKTRKVTHGFGKIGSGTTPKSDSDDYYDGEIAWVTTSELREIVIETTKQTVSAKALKDYPTLALYPPGTLLIAMYGATIGRLGLLGIHATVNQACGAFALPTLFDSKFVFYWLWMRKPILLSISVGGGQPNLSQDDLRQLRIPVPSVAEQQLIAAFLDRETAKIDTLLAKKRALIMLLKEKRAAEISQAVTRGLNPDAELKDSGVEWLGQVPEHWTVGRLKDFGEIVGGSGFPHDFQGVEDEEVPFYKVSDTNLSGNERLMSKAVNTVSLEVAQQLRATIIPKDSIVYAKIGAALLLNKRRITTRPCCIDNNMSAFINGKAVLPEWSYYWFSILDFGEFSNPGAVPSFSEGDQAVLPFLCPDLSEQEVVVHYLDRETAKIDGLISKVEAAIAKLKELRVALITAAVTGKIDVRGGGFELG